MSEMGDDFRAQREFRREARSQWHDCPNCIYGGNARKIAPGAACHECGWVAPGRRGEDLEHARRAERTTWDDEARDLAQKAARQADQADRTCDICKRVFGNRDSLRMHRRMKHAKHARRLQRSGGPR